MKVKEPNKDDMLPCPLWLSILYARRFWRTRLLLWMAIRAKPVMVTGKLTGSNLLFYNVFITFSISSTMLWFVNLKYVTFHNNNTKWAVKCLLHMVSNNICSPAKNVWVCSCYFFLGYTTVLYDSKLTAKQS